MILSCPARVHHKGNMIRTCIHRFEVCYSTIELCPYFILSTTILLPLPYPGLLPLGRKTGSCCHSTTYNKQRALPNSTFASISSGEEIYVLKVKRESNPKTTDLQSVCRTTLPSQPSAFLIRCSSRYFLCSNPFPLRREDKV